MKFKTGDNLVSGNKIVNIVGIINTGIGFKGYVTNEGYENIPFDKESEWKLKLKFKFKVGDYLISGNKIVDIVGIIDTGIGFKGYVTGEGHENISYDKESEWELYHKDLNDECVCIKCGRILDENKWCDTCKSSDFAVTNRDRNSYLKMKGNVRVYIGSEHQLPCIVHVSHLNQLGWIVCNILNTDTTIFADVNQLTNFDVTEFGKIYRKAKLVQLEKQVQSLREEIEKDNV